MLVNDILKLELADYEKARHRIKSISESLPGFINFGQFGIVGQPSISDLDIFICFNDNNIKTNFEIIKKEVKSDEILNYIFTHPPLILPKSVMPLVPYLHSLYNLNLDCEPKNLINKSIVGEEYKDFLNLLWTIFLIPISLKIIRYPEKFGFRFALLVLKNLHQSLENVKPNGGAQIDYLGRSKNIRALAIESKISSIEIIKEYHFALNKLMEIMTELNLGRQTKFKKNSLKLPKSIQILNSKICKFEIVERVTIFKLNDTFFEILYGLMGNIVMNENLNSHVEKAKKAFELFKNLDVPYPFIKPFGIPYYQSDIKSRIKFYLKILVEKNENVKPVIFKTKG